MKHNALVPFGGGPRMCIGNRCVLVGVLALCSLLCFRFVTEEIKLALIRLYQRFSFKYTLIVLVLLLGCAYNACCLLQVDGQEPRPAEGGHQNAAAAERGRVGHCAPA